jgi:hypothetical protein
MSRKELVLLVSRAFALLMIAWAFVELTYLPDRLLGLVHHLNERSVLTPHEYLTNYYFILTASTVLRMLVFLFVAVLFWNCGPRVEAVFSPPQIGHNETGEESTP